jgi:hypothetical protein
VKVKRLFSTTPEAEIFSKSSWIETEANGGHWGDRTLNWTRSRLTGCVRSVVAAVRCGSLEFCTSVSGHSRDRRVRIGARGTANAKDRSDAVVCPVTINRTRSVVCGCLLESTGRWHCGVRSIQAACSIAWSATRIVATGRQGASDQF